MVYTGRSKIPLSITDVHRNSKHNLRSIQKADIMPSLQRYLQSRSRFDSRGTDSRTTAIVVGICCGAFAFLMIMTIWLWRRRNLGMPQSTTPTLCKRNEEGTSGGAAKLLRRVRQREGGGWLERLERLVSSGRLENREAIRLCISYKLQHTGNPIHCRG